ncbi:N-acetylglucosamine-6-phosphate deacetylase [Tessaracoccus sp. HDW20]|uniref:N-acetylglucosamine-6-phosphate deacetylase n=1 Tax=Tessaracoccus coleopterorum TaxID=2714950 RepID=UPI0018D3ACA5|nr:N-acetylglucosamine-6-phosphate deacetylase [Tessaracoccus coleopterorum]NHB85100.1 N-acetylglucosamine-6-phosphate deacetylase [Tessaracoccus coleopterorum]
MDRVFRNGTLILPDGAVPGQDLWIRDGIIVTAGATGTLNAPTDAEVIDVEGLVIGPGFVDIHCHAGAGAWAMRTRSPRQKASCAMARRACSRPRSCTRLPTSRWRPSPPSGLPSTRAHPQRPRHPHGGAVSEPRLRCLQGVVEAPAVAEYERFVTAARGRLRTMTIAPEIPGVTEMVHDLQRLTGGSMTFSVGHSTASSEAIDALVPAGLRLCTHLFNATGCAIEPTRYAGTREVGVDEAVLLNNSIWAEVVADRLGCHVRPDLLRLAYQVKGRDRLIVVTDATAAEGAAPEGGLNDGERPDVRFNEAGGSPVHR